MSVPILDDSREADERREERQLRDLRARVKAARATASRHPELARAVIDGSPRTAWFLARFGISPAEFRAGAPDECAVRFAGD